MPPIWLLITVSLGIPLAAIYLLGYLYARAMLRGLASARDQQHRLTPRSPWFYFDREYASTARRIKFASLPCLAGSISAPWFLPNMYFGGIESLWVPVAYLLDWIPVLGLTLALIVLFAPSFRSPLGLAVAGLIMGYFLRTCAWWSLRIPWIPGD